MERYKESVKRWEEVIRRYVKDHTDLPEGATYKIIGYAHEHCDDSHELADLCNICQELYDEGKFIGM